MDDIKLLRKAGCRCPNPLVGQRPNVGPRCRLCGIVAVLRTKVANDLEAYLSATSDFSEEDIQTLVQDTDNAIRKREQEIAQKHADHWDKEFNTIS